MDSTQSTLNMEKYCNIDQFGVAPIERKKTEKFNFSLTNQITS